MGEHTFDATVVLEGLRELPGGRDLIDLARGRTDVALVGGAVRDLLLGRTPRELDIVVAGGESSPGSALLFARALAACVDVLAETNEHERFGTALVAWDGARVDVAGARRERYAAPGALPEVAPATLDDDLLRRDLTVNAIAVTLDTTRPGEVRAPPGALADLRAGRLRVLHDASFIDDPTRLLRLARYRARLGFTIEEHTADLAAAAVRTRALNTVSLARIGVELRLALSEPDIVGAIASIDNLGLLQALDSALTFNEPVARHALTLLAEADGDTRPDLLLLTSLFTPGGYPIYYEGEERDREQAGWLLDELEFLATDRDLVVKALADGPHIAFGLLHAQTPAEVHRAAARSSLEAVALIGALGTMFAKSEDCAITQGARRWLAELHGLRLQITGDDLLAAGVPQGPEVGRRLEAALHAKLDGELDGEGREAELRAALEA